MLKIGLNTVTLQQYFMAIWIFTMALMNLMMLDGIVGCMSDFSLKKSIAVLLGVCLIFDNVFVMEMMLFPEMAMWLIIGNLALGLSVWMILHENKKISKWVMGTFFLLVALGCYQSYVGIFEALVLLGFFLKYENNSVKRYQSAAAALTIGGCASVLNILLVKLLLKLGLVGDSGRGATFNLTKILENLKALGQYQLGFWKNADGFFPVGVMPVLLIVLLAICIKVFMTKRGEQRVYLVLMIVGTYVLAFAPHIVEAHLCITPRSNLAIWSVIAVILIMGICWSSNDVQYAVVCVVIAVLLVNQGCVANDMAANERANNAVDFTEAKMIADKIYEYEAETGNFVSKVAMKYDTAATLYGSETKYANFQLGARILATAYSNYRLMGYVMGRNFEKVDMPEAIYESNFLDKNWDRLDVNEQVYCEGDTAYIMVY